MEAWARSIPNVQFLCICVESKQVALSFHRMFNFQKVINGYIPSRGYLPRGYGQLGCSGFIVSDGKGCFVSRKTSAYLDVGDAAFEDVESLLAAIVEDPSVPTVQIDTKQRSKKEVGGKILFLQAFYYRKLFFHFHSSFVFIKKILE